jgi:TIR domain
MTDVADGKYGFFISFNQADRAWATWIAWVLEENGSSYLCNRKWIANLAQPWL